VQLTAPPAAPQVDGLLNWTAHKTLKAAMETPRSHPLPADGGAESWTSSRRLLDETLGLWTTEFGRIAHDTRPPKPGHDEKKTRRMKGVWWMEERAWSKRRPRGLRPATDRFRLQGRRRQVPPTIYDVHATVLHLLGLDEEALTYVTQRQPAAVDGWVPWGR